jgi:hypothetical protein
MADPPEEFKELEARLTTSLSDLFADPSFLGSPLLTVLDELQVALDASRLDAAVVEPGKEPSTISSATRRECGEDKRNWKPSDQQGSAQGIAWWLETPDCVLPADTKIRSALSASSRRLRFQFSRPPSFHEGEKNFTLTEITIWIPDSSQLFVKTESAIIPSQVPSSVIPSINACLELAVQTPVHEDPLQGSRVFGRLAGDSRTILLGAFEALDRSLKSLLRARGDKELSKYLFLNQFFWVTDRASDPVRPSKPESTSNLATVMPVFLDPQEESLKYFFEKEVDVKPAWPSKWEEAVKWLNNTQLDSRSLFSAFPADTRLSLYVEDWPSEIKKALPTDPTEQPEFDLFSQLTKNAHQRAGEDVGLKEDGTLNLFAVPVLVGDQPLFVVTMSIPRGLSREERADLAARIRAIGWMMRSHERMYEMARRSKQIEEKALFEHTQIVMSKALDISSYVSQVVELIPATIGNVFREELEKAARMGTDTVELTRQDLRKALRSWDHVLNKANELSQRVAKGNKETIDLTTALQRAISSIPTSFGLNVRVDTHDKRIPYDILGIRGSLDFVLTQIIVTAATQWVDNKQLRIRVGKRYEESFGDEGNVRVEFLDDCAMPGRARFEDIAKGDQYFTAACFEVERMNGVIEFDMQVRDEERSVDACCVVKLPASR